MIHHFTVGLQNELGDLPPGTDHWPFRKVIIIILDLKELAASSDGGSQMPLRIIASHAGISPQVVCTKLIAI